MKELIAKLEQEKQSIEATIKQLKDQIFVLNAKSKSIDKAIKALEPK